MLAAGGQTPATYSFIVSPNIVAANCRANCGRRQSRAPFPPAAEPERPLSLGGGGLPLALSISCAAAHLLCSRWPDLCKWPLLIGELASWPAGALILAGRSAALERRPLAQFKPPGLVVAPRATERARESGQERA